MKNTFIVILLFLLPFRVITQNLVPNWSFEDYIQCPNNGGELNGYVKNWENGNLATSDYFNKCSSDFATSTPWNGPGYQFPKNGFAYCGLVIGCTDDTRDYITVELSDILTQNKTYCIGFYVSLANADNNIWTNRGSRFATDRIGLYISDTSIFYSSLINIPVIPQIQNPIGNYIMDTINWVLIKGKYIASGGEKYITLGNFYNNSNTNYIQISNSMTYDAYYYIDDVFIYDCDIVDTANAGEDKTICRGDSVQIGTNNNVGYKYKWLPNIGLSNDTIGNPMASPQVTTTYYLTCTKYMATKDSVTVYVENCGGSFTVPNAFTPNGDGVNDVFRVKGQNIKTLHGTIINIWGQELFKWDNINGGWDGKYKGQYVSAGAYFYFMEVEYLNGEMEVKKGSVEVVRE